MELKSYIAILAPPKHKNNHAAVELNLIFLASLLQCTFIYKCALQLKAKKNKKLFYSHTIFFLILSCFHSPFSVSLFTASPSLLSSSTNPQTLLSSSQTITDLHEPSCHRSIAADPCLAVDLTHFDLSSLFLAFRLCVSSCAYVLALCFGLCLCFSFFFRDGFMFRAMIFLLFFFFLLHWF